MSTPDFAKIKEFLLKYEYKIVIAVGFCLISAISYQFGVLQGQKWQQKPLVIEKPVQIPQEGQIGQIGAPGAPEKDSLSSVTAAPAAGALSAAGAGCPYVGSKSSTKFYLATCSWAKSIKPENMVCFKSAEQAVGQGRTESKCAK